MLDKPVGFVLLFIASAAFWWFFEYLNRFVQNWHYLAVINIGPWKYFIHGSVCFSTVLPAVYSVKCYLRTLPVLQRIGAGGPPLRFRFEVEVGVAAVSLFTVIPAFFFMGLYPGFLFPFLWFGPLIGWLALNRLTGGTIYLGGLRTGNWTYVFNWALAALVCGFFWEMWNFYSLPKWDYQIPYFGAVQIFEMPLAGYLGYLPFGLQCALAVEFILPARRAKSG